MPLFRVHGPGKERAVYIPYRDISATLCSPACLLRHLDKSARIVRTGQTQSTELTVLLEKNRLLVPLSGAKRQRVHILGEQQNTLQPKERWLKIWQLHHPALMRVLALCDCMAEVGIVDGEALEDADTTPPWKAIRDLATQPNLNPGGPVPYLKWQGWMHDLASGLAALEKQGLAHGDPFPFNVVTANDRAVWVDFSHLSDDPRQVLKDTWAFVLYTLLHSHKKTDSFSKSLIAEVGAALVSAHRCSAPTAVERALEKTYTDWLPLDDTREVGVCFTDTMEQLQFWKEDASANSFGGEIILKGSLQYFSDFLHYIAVSSNLKRMHRIEMQRHRLMEQEMLRLTVPQAEHNQVVVRMAECDRKILNLNAELTSVNAQLNTILNSYSWKVTAPVRFVTKCIRSGSFKGSYRDAMVSGLRFIYRRTPLPSGLRMSLRSLFFRLTGWSKSDTTILPENIPSFLSMTSSATELQPFFGVRRPYGKRQAAILTNQLLDWHDGRPRFGGGERYALELARLLKELGIAVTFFQPSHKGGTEGEYYSFEVKTVQVGDAVGEFQHGVCSRFTQVASDYDHLYYHLPEYASGLVREDGLMTCHGIWFDHNNYVGAVFRTKEWFKHLYRAFSNPLTVISVDTNSIGVIRSLWPEVARKMHYIPNFYDSSKYRPEYSKRSTGRVTVLFPRRSQINRGSRIFGEIVQSIPHDVRIVWVGEGDPEDTELIKRVCTSDPRASFFTADFDEMAHWYQCADIAVIPTIACEGTSLACIEALASGCAVVATTVGGLTDIIHDGFNGLLADPNPHSISTAINMLIENKALRERLQQIGCESVKSLELSHWRDRWVDVFNDHGWIDSESYSRWKTKDGETYRRPQSERWLVLTRNATHGGVESIIRDQSKMLSAPVVVCGGLDLRNSCPFDYTRADNVDTLRKAILGYDVILYHWLPDWALDVLKETKAFTLEFVHRTDTCDNDKSIPRGIVTHSPFLAKHIYKQYGRLCRVVEHPINASQFIPNEAGGICIGAVTSYYKTKGIDIFLEAWARLKKEFPLIPVRFYGSGDDRHKLEKKAAELGVEVEFRPPTEKPWEALREFRCFVVPSKIEGFPVAILEALAMNIPVVASDLAGVMDFNQNAVQRGYAPFIHTARTGDPEDFARVIGTTLRQDRKLESRDYICEYFSLSKHLDDLRNAFLEFARRT